MIDYFTLQGSTENPTFLSIFFTVVLSFILSSLIALTYQKTTRQVITPIEFLQSLILVSIVAATVMQAIGDSLARGLGMLGALAIIRFRTNLKEPRNMVFTFASLAAGIACGVYGFVIGIVGTVGFCLTAIILRFSPLSYGSKLLGNLRLVLPGTSEYLNDTEEILNLYCKRYLLVGYEFEAIKNKEKLDLPKEKKIAYEYQFQLKQAEKLMDFEAELSSIPNIGSVKIGIKNNPESV